MNEKLKFPSNFISNQFVKYITQNELQSIVKKLGSQLSEQYKGQELVLIGVLKGSVVFLADLIREIRDVKVYIDFIRLKVVGRDKEHDGTIKIIKDISTDLSGKNILIVEEIIDSARTLNFIKNRIQLANPQSVKIMTLFNKPYKRVAPISIEYEGEKIENHFIVGYGLDLEDFGRNFEEVYYLKYPN